jgi:UDP-N-acetylglucosamine 2-epimerase (non-hydrolysing)
MRTNTERPEAVESGAARLVGINSENIVSAAAELLSDPGAYNKMASAGATNPYGDGHASERIVRAIEDYFFLKNEAPELTESGIEAL